MRWGFYAAIVFWFLVWYLAHPPSFSIVALALVSTVVLLMGAVLVGALMIAAVVVFVVLLVWVLE